MSKLRRRAIAKSVGKTYKTDRRGGYTIKDEFGSVGVLGYIPDDETFISYMRMGRQ